MPESKIKKNQFFTIDIKLCVELHFFPRRKNLAKFGLIFFKRIFDSVGMKKWKKVCLIPTHRI